MITSEIVEDDLKQPCVGLCMNRPPKYHYKTCVFKNIDNIDNIE